MSSGLSTICARTDLASTKPLYHVSSNCGSTYSGTGVGTGVGRGVGDGVGVIRRAERGKSHAACRRRGFGCGARIAVDVEPLERRYGGFFIFIALGFLIPALIYSADRLDCFSGL